MRQFFQEYGSQLVSKTIEHFYISIIALLIAIVVAVPLGILLSKTKRIANVVLTIAGVLQTIPTLAVLAIMIPIFGVGKTDNCRIVHLCIVTNFKQYSSGSTKY